MSKKLLSLLGLTSALTLSAAASAGPILTFEGITPYPDDDVLVDGFYNNIGIDFTGNGRVVCLNTPELDVPCSGASRGEEGPSMWYGFFWPVGSQNPIMNVAAGFEKALGFVYANAWDSDVQVEIWSELDGTGTKLASLDLAGTPNQACGPFAMGAFYCPFVSEFIGFNGVAKSVVFAGTPENMVIFDDIEVPEPATWMLLAAGAGLAGFGKGRQRRS